MITLKDIAAVVGVAPSTVGRALADHPHVHESTKARVREVAASLGYVAHAPARVMRGGHSDLVGLLIPDVRNDFYSTAAQAISEACARSGFHVVLSITGDDPHREREHLRGLVGARCAGVVVVPSARPLRETRALLAQVAHVQLIRRAKGLHAPWFGIDDAASSRLAAGRLLAAGHRAIGYVGGDLRLSTGEERFAGFRAALAAAGIEPTPRWCAHDGCDAQTGVEATRRVLAGAPRPTALVLAGSRLTIGALDALLELGLEVPRAISVVGFNDSPTLAGWGPGVTSIGLPVGEIAAACATGLLERVRGAAGSGAPAPRPAEARFAPFLIERGSIAPPDRRAKARAA